METVSIYYRNCIISYQNSDTIWDFKPWFQIVIITLFSNIIFGSDSLGLVWFFDLSSVMNLNRFSKAQKSWRMWKGCVKTKVQRINVKWISILWISSSNKEQCGEASTFVSSYHLTPRRELSSFCFPFSSHFHFMVSIHVNTT